MNDHIWYFLGYIILISGYDVNGLPMNHHDFDFFSICKISYVLHAIKHLLIFNTA